MEDSILAYSAGIPEDCILAASSGCDSLTCVILRPRTALRIAATLNDHAVSIHDSANV